MKTSIIIPSLNSPIINRVLKNIEEQTVSEQISEILIIGKDSANLIPNQKRINFIDTGDPVSAAKARNIGIEQSHYNTLIFLDSDCLPKSNWLEEHIKAQTVGHSIVGGGVLPQGTNYWSLSYNLTMFHEFLSTVPASKRHYLPTLNLSVQRDVIIDVGLLNETLLRGQDIEWTTRMRRAGYEPYFWPTAIVEHVHNRTNLSKVWQDCVRSGYHMRQIRMENPDMLQSPGILRHRHAVLGLSPAIAAWTTAKIIKRQPSTFRKNWHTLPAIFLTKLAWCWGASQNIVHTTKSPYAHS